MVLGLILSTALLAPAQGSIDTQKAARYFQEAKWISDDDNGALWGKALYGPMMFANPRTREAVANEDPPEMGFRRDGSVFSGKLPDSLGIANYAFEWQGKKWTMVMWPPPENRSERARLMLHELLHRIQDEIGLPGVAPGNAHLDTYDGRVWLQLEVRALQRALKKESVAGQKLLDTMRRDIEDALTFRAYRQALVPGAKASED